MGVLAREIHDGRGEAPGGGDVATTFPTKNLPPVTYRDMPNRCPCARSSALG